MRNKLWVFFTLLLFIATEVLADGGETSVLSSKDGKVVLNNPTIGSKQGSDEQFGIPKIQGEKGKSYYTKDHYKVKNNPVGVGSRQGSNQIFGEPKIQGEKGKEYYTKEQYKVNNNLVKIGSKQGSNQIFGEPKPKN